MSVDLITGTAVQATVYIAVIELKPIQNIDIVVEIFAVHDEYVLFVSDIEAAVLVAVKMHIAKVGTQWVWTFGVFAIGVEALWTVFLDLWKKSNIINILVILFSISFARKQKTTLNAY